VQNLFELRGDLGKGAWVIEILGVLCLLAVWYLITALGFVSPTLLPTPYQVVTCVPSLHFDDALVRNLLYSLYLNGAGYLEAIAVCVPLGFVIGLFPLFRGLFSRPVNAIRFVPLTAITGLFIVWFGIDDRMKIQFLALGIIVYLLPVVMQRVDEVAPVYQQTAFTLGATKWQTIRTVFFPAVLSRLADDIRVLVAISWTYIIIAEMLNSSGGGIGALAYSASRQGRVDKVFAILFVIVLVGFIQDLLFKALDKYLFPYKEA
jgi:NitT/TauT family transport system permease protein